MGYVEIKRVCMPDILPEPRRLVQRAVLPGGVIDAHPYRARNRSAVRESCIHLYGDVAVNGGIGKGRHNLHEHAYRRAPIGRKTARMPVTGSAVHSVVAVSVMVVCGPRAIAPV